MRGAFARLLGQAKAPQVKPDLLLMRRAAARGIRPGRVDCCIALFDVDDLAFLIDYKRRPVGHAVLRHQDTIRRRHFALREVAQKWKLYVVFGGKFFLGRSIVCTDPENLGL